MSSILCIEAPIIVSIQSTGHLITVRYRHLLFFYLLFFLMFQLITEWNSD